MAKLMKMLQPLQSEYVDRRFDGTKEEYFQQLDQSSTLYIGNLSFYTTEDQIYELFGKVGVVRRVIMGLDRNTKTPCGFCFVIYHTRSHALAAVRYLNGTKLDNRQLRVDIDYGFEEGRQFGRGRSGGQVRDEFRTDYDADRGGYGRVVAQQLASQQLAMWQEVQAGALLGAGVLPASAGGAVFFGQDQREDLGQQHKAGAVQAADGDADSSAVVNPRMAGRGRDGDDEEDQEQDGDGGGDEQQQQQQQQHRDKRRRVGGDDAAAAAAATGDEEQQQQDEAAAEDSGGDAEQDDELHTPQGEEEEAVAASPNASDDERPDHKRQRT